MLNKVLVVEDEQLLAENLKDYLQAQALDVRIAHDGATGIGEAELFEPDVMVFDYRLPDMEGFEVLDAVRRNRKCHFVLITGHPTAEVCERARQLGVSHILFKPFPMAELARAVCDLLGMERESKTGMGSAEGFVERRQSRTESFPLQLYDGSWVLADRRRIPSTSNAPDDGQLLTGD
ncbi:response regulator [Pseudomonas fluorescens]|uniref:Regulator of RpoS n=1 Tax=Pseudomonas fluorescens TaxID=294 RepID=A0A5E7DJF7_PSEFL|nr:response regulator [Pseudomonas fluorescens]VVN66700.1 Regulator of RpoS [Pseudomonas fluorescens]VVO17533.1 Regulator of RpoS [Pseudomonas fluorescens]VVQ02830.1 Regulator of RpoS [Pseudomonas fluorescens]